MSKFNSDLQIGDITDVYERLKSITPGGRSKLFDVIIGSQKLFFKI